VSFPRAGDYAFVFSLDGEEAARYGVRVAQVGVIAWPLPQAPNGDGDDSQEEE
jgi:hypothetical protein